MIYSWTIEKILQQILIEHSIDCVVENVVSGFYASMSYNPSENKIKFNHYNLSGTYEKYFKSINENDFIKIISYHEIGHYLDFKENGLRDKITMEISAWEKGEEIIPRDLLSNYNEVKNLHLEKMLK